MLRIKSAIAGGLVGTLLTGSMMLMNNAIHRLPNLGIGQMLATLLGEPEQVMIGWIAFIVLGLFVCSLVFVALEPHVPIRSYLVKGLVFGFASWLVMMLVLMPLVGAEAFALNRGHITAAATLVLNLVYWVVLSLFYRWGVGGTDPAASRRVKA